MDPNIKALLFQQNDREKLDNAQMSLEEWKFLLYGRPVAVTIEKTIHKRQIQQNKVVFQVKQTDPLWPTCEVASRSKSDFKLLYSQLMLRFPHAIVPPLPRFDPRTDEVPLLELYLEKLAANPFFRNDVPFVDFVDGKLKVYSQTKRKDRNRSEGTLRWMQCLSEYNSPNPVDEEYTRVLKADFDALERSQNVLLKSFRDNARALEGLHESSAAIGAAFEGMNSMEKAAEGKVPISTAGTPGQRLSDTILNTTNINNAHVSALGRAFGGGTFIRQFVNPILYDLQVISAFKRFIDKVATKLGEYERAKLALENQEAGNATDPAKQKAKETMLEKHIEFCKASQALASEIETYKAFRTVNFGKFFEDYVRFHLRGANEMYKEWAATGVTHEASSDAEFFRKDRRYAVGLTTNIKGGKADVARSTAAMSQAIGAVDKKNTLHLMVVEDFVPRGRMGGKYLKVTKGEILTGSKNAEGIWHCVNSQGKRGLVRPELVAIRAQGNLGDANSTAVIKSRTQSSASMPKANPSPPRTFQVGPPPGLPSNHMEERDRVTKISEADNTGDDNEDWSVSDAGNNEQDFRDDEPAPIPVAKPKAVADSRNNNIPIAKPLMPQLPPGLAGSTLAASRRPSTKAIVNSSANANLEPVVLPLPTKASVADIKKFEPPTGAPRSMMNSFNPPPSHSDTGFGMPGAMPTGIPDFKAPTGNSRPIPAPPLHDPAPARAPVGRPAFNPMAAALEDIGKGQLKNLKKVPEAEKSKEIGGAFDGKDKPAVGHLGTNSSAAPAKGGMFGGGGGNLQAELAAKLKRKQG